jgi:hypothetical protein
LAAVADAAVAVVTQLVVFAIHSQLPAASLGAFVGVIQVQNRLPTDCGRLPQSLANTG